MPAFITNLPYTKDVKNCCNREKGSIKNLKKGSIVIDMSTISPDGAVEIDDKLKIKIKLY